MVPSQSGDCPESDEFPATTVLARMALPEIPPPVLVWEDGTLKTWLATTVQLRTSRGAPLAMPPPCIPMFPLIVQLVSTLGPSFALLLPSPPPPPPVTPTVAVLPLMVLFDRVRVPRARKMPPPPPVRAVFRAMLVSEMLRRPSL